MTIVPAGKRKPQINQGASKYDSLLEENLFKQAIVSSPITNSPQNTPTELDNDLASALGPGSNNPSISGQYDRGQYDRMSNDMGSPNRFLTPDGSQEEENPETVAVMQEKAKIRSVAKGFNISLKKTKDGAFEVILTPPTGYKIPDPDALVQAIMQAVRGDVQESSDPDPRGGGMRIVYQSQLGPQQMVMKSKNKRGR